MVDYKDLLANPEKYAQAAMNKGVKVDVEAFIALDQKRREIQTKLDAKREEQNKASKEIGQSKPEKRKEMISAVTGLKEEIQKLEGEIRPVVEEWEQHLMSFPNVHSPSMPVGKDEEDNVVLREWGSKPEFDFEPKTHEVLGEELRVLDTEKAAQVSGARFSYLKGDLVLLQFALHQLAFATLTDEQEIKAVIEEKKLSLASKPFVPMLPPVIIKNEVQEKIHRVFGDQTYKLAGTEEGQGLNLVASAEHTLAPYHMEEVIPEELLPLRYIGYSTAFRQEAGTYGKDMKGFFRTHQFDKSEMESFTTAESAEEEQLLLLGLQERMVQKLGLHYQVVQICTGDTGKPDYQQFDLNTWFPGQGRYRETHTSDYMGDYQTRGINSFYKTKEGDKKLLHTNDATAFAGRSLIAIMENYQQRDGSIVVPEVLRRWLGKEAISK